MQNLKKCFAIAVTMAATALSPLALADEANDQDQLAASGQPAGDATEGTDRGGLLGHLLAFLPIPE